MTTLLSYSQEIAPMFRSLQEAKEVLKEFKEKSEQVQKLQQAVKDAQEELAKFLEEDATASNLLREIKDLNTDIGLATKAAAKGTQYKPAELKQYFAARAKDQGVEKVVEKAELFNELESELNS